jgi:membrane associated rhomboid family serine protease
MGYQDREYYQDAHGPRGFQFSSDLSYTWRIVILNVALWLLNFFLNGKNWSESVLLDYVTMHGDTLVKPWLWFQFVTYSFFHDPSDLQHLFWNMLSLAIFGSEIERVYGKREFLRYYLVAAAFGGIAWGVRVFLMYGVGSEARESLDLHAMSMMGASGVTTALTILFCLRNPFAKLYLMMLLPVPAWVVGAIIVVGSLLQAPSHGTVAHDVHLAGALFAVLYFTGNWRLTRVLSFGWLENLGTSLRRLVKPRPRLKVYDDEPDDAVYRDLEIEADRILGKIAEEGENSLSQKERQTLERYSRLMRQKLR